MSTTTLWFTRHPLRLLGDMVHLASFLILLLKIKSRHSCAGTSVNVDELVKLFFCFISPFLNSLDLLKIANRYFAQNSRNLRYHICCSILGLVYKSSIILFDRHEDYFHSLNLLCNISHEGYIQENLFKGWRYFPKTASLPGSAVCRTFHSPHCQIRNYRSMKISYSPNYNCEKSSFYLLLLLAHQRILTSTFFWTDFMDLFYFIGGDCHSPSTLDVIETWRNGRSMC